MPQTRSIYNDITSYRVVSVYNILYVNVLWDARSAFGGTDWKGNLEYLFALAPFFLKGQFDKLF